MPVMFLCSSVFVLGQKMAELTPSPAPMSYDYDINDAYDAYSEVTMQALRSLECMSSTCVKEYRGDGECDLFCNTAPCDWDEGDCFHDDDGCYNHPTGGDYRGNVSWTKSGKRCQYWSSQWPNTHTYTTKNYPDSNLGGHNSCRNPDPSDNSTGPWCAHTGASCDLVGLADSPSWLAQVLRRCLRCCVGILRRGPAEQDCLPKPPSNGSAQPYGASVRQVARWLGV